MDRPRGAQGQGHPITGEISGANSGSQWFLLVGRLIGISVLLTPLVPLATSRLQTVSGYLYPSQSQVPERPCVNMRISGGWKPLSGEEILPGNLWYWNVLPQRVRSHALACPHASLMWGSDKDLPKQKQKQKQKQTETVPVYD